MATLDVRLTVKAPKYTHIRKSRSAETYCGASMKDNPTISIEHYDARATNPAIAGQIDALPEKVCYWCQVDLRRRGDIVRPEHTYHEYVGAAEGEPYRGCKTCGFGPGALQHNLSMQDSDPDGILLRTGGSR